MCFGATGTDGSTTYDFQAYSCFDDDREPDRSFIGKTSWNALIPVEAGREYLLAVSWRPVTHYYDADFLTFNYTLDLTLGDDVGLFDTIPPVLEHFAAPDTCGQNTFDVSFSEYIENSTISAANFYLEGPTGQTYDFQLGGYSYDRNGRMERDFRLFCNPPLVAPGAYRLHFRSPASDPVTDGCGNPAATAVFDFEVVPTDSFTLDLGNDFRYCDFPYRLDAPPVVGTDVHYQWSDGSTESYAVVTEPGEYVLTVTRDCAVSADTIELMPCETGCSFYLPNAFSPNGDGENDFWQPSAGCVVENARLEVYDRSGNRLFAGTDRWDGSTNGRRAAVGTYVVRWTGSYREAEVPRDFVEYATVALLR